MICSVLMMLEKESGGKCVCKLCVIKQAGASIFATFLRKRFSKATVFSKKTKLTFSKSFLQLSNLFKKQTNLK